MLHDSVYLLLVVFVFYLVIYRIKRNQREGFKDIDGRIVTIYIKRAHDKKLGLMHRKNKLKKNHGLLFDYNRYGVFTFWMKDTYIPLEVMCLDHNYKVVGVIEDLKPKSKKSRTLDRPFRYAIEVNKGTSKKNSLKEGDYIEFIETDEI
tara:strand:+ start:670 stop:1116 length:447 start_codon:yes stop_codon:yes gene_type:complete